MQSRNTDQCDSKMNQVTLKTVHTGLFVKWDTCSLLLNIVQDVLRNRFMTAALNGPRRPDNTCEVLLRALYPSGAHFSGSQELLESYLKMIKESKPNIYVEKQTEVIDLVDDDNETCIVLEETLDDSVTIIEEKTHAKNNAKQLKNHSAETAVDKQNISVTASQDDVLIISSSSSKKSMNVKSASNIETGSILKESNQQRKRKLIEKEEARSVVDDEIIILDDSFPELNNCVRMQHNSINQGASNWRVTVTEDQRYVQQEPGNNSSSHVRNMQDYVEMTCNNTKDLQPKKKQNSAENPEFSGSTSRKKAQKLTYKRPAHLRQPLIQSTSADIPKAESNIYKAEVVEKRTGLRPIVIDGNNVGVSHGKGHFSLKGVQICINYFEKRGHRHIKAFLPHYRTNKGTFDELHKMSQQGTVVFTPSRKVDGRTVASYDDRYIVQYATEMGGVIVSTDNYRDLQEENPDWKETIQTRLLMFTWVDDLLMFPQDPLGRKGPSLDTFLKFPDPV